ncbi:MAG: EamA family transporter [Chitinophagaceae bacterium]
MFRIDITKTLSQTTGSIKRLSAFNPFTIRKKGRRTKAIFALLLVCFLWGTTWVAAKEGVKHMPAMQMAGLRQLFAGLLYVIFFIIKGAKFPRGKEWIPVIVLSILNFALSNGLSNWGIQHISAGLGAIIAAIFPLWLVLIGLFTSAKKIPTKAIIGLLVGFAGVCIIFSEHFLDFLISDFRFGIFLSLTASLTWALATLYTKHTAADFNPYFSLGLQMVISGTVILLITKATNSPQVKSFIPLQDIPIRSWLSIVYLVIFSSAIAFVAYLYALQNLPTEQVSIYAYINPIVAVLLGWILFNEHVSILLTVGGAVILTGVYLVNKAFKARSPMKQPETEGM